MSREGLAVGVVERKSRERAIREHRITAAARQIAEREGWNAVTIRRLAAEIEYSQPVLYSHFDNRDAIVAAVAIDGFGELAATLRVAVYPMADRQEALRKVGTAYLAFACEQPALYEAMFVRPTELHFAEADTKLQLREAFAALAAVVTPTGVGDGVATEAFWATLHGLAELERSGRIRGSSRDARLILVVDAFAKLE